jgi:hypothetical protein
MHHDGLPANVERAGGALLSDLQRPGEFERHLRFLQAHPRCHRCGARATAETNQAVDGRRVALCRSCAKVNEECRAYIAGKGPLPIERRARPVSESEKRARLARLAARDPAIAATTRTTTGPYAAVLVNPGTTPSASRRAAARYYGY